MPLYLILNLNVFRCFCVCAADINLNKVVFSNSYPLCIFILIIHSIQETSNLEDKTTGCGLVQIL